MSSDPVRDPVPAASRAVIDLFRRALPDVRFPDVDLEALEDAERALIEAQRELESAEAALERARAVLAERSSALSAKGQRALAYARIYAEGDEALGREVELAAGGRERAKESTALPPKRGRKRKSEAEGTTLFEAEAPIELAS